MLTANDALHGWSPADDNDDIEVNVSQNMYFMAINPTTSALSAICPPLDAPLPKTRPPLSQSTPLVPLTDLTHIAIAPSSDRRAQRNRNRDPSWIPRPRNAFIIFRCEYSREHAQGSGESQDDTDGAKSLSKRAAEAWRNLPPSEIARYKVLANMEREEHARLYPNYRFRPMKRQVSGTRRSPCGRSKSPKATSVERRPPPSDHVPSVLATAPVKPSSNPSVGRVEISAPAPAVSAAPLQEPSPRVDDQPAAQTDPDVSLNVDPNDHMLFYPPSEETSPIDLFSSLYSSGVNIPPDAFHDSVYDLPSTHDDLERAQALEAYALGLYNHDLFSPFLFPEHC